MNRHFYLLFLPIHLCGVAAAWLYRHEWDLMHLAILFVSTFFVLFIGVNLGLHRMLSHRHFETKISKRIRNTIIFLSLFAGGGGPISWAAIHRHHHKYSDTDLDIHSPRQGFLNSFLLWMIRNDQLNSFRISLLRSRDLQKSNTLKGFEQYYYQIVWTTIAAITLSFGFQLACCLIIFPMIVSIMHESSINYFCHTGTSKFGYRNFETQDCSLNYLAWGWLSFGAAYQNNHHMFPENQNFAFRPREFDMTYSSVNFFIRLHAKLRNLR